MRLNQRDRTILELTAMEHLLPLDWAINNVAEPLSSSQNCDFSNFVFDLEKSSEVIF